MSEPAPRAPRPVDRPDWPQSLPCRIGEILIRENSCGGFALCHRDDTDRADLVETASAEAATELARYDDAGNYRPLKTAPNLRHGWRIVVADIAAVRLALDLFYPGRVAAFEAHRAGKLRATNFRETLERQTGMYRAAAKITDEQADNLIGNFCRSDGGCLRTILWRRNADRTVASTLLPPAKFDPQHDQAGRGEQAIPLLCQEICNVLVAAAREVVKTAR
ncbi:MAG: DR2241 family protein [Chthoniobacterales bacterium]